MASIRLYQFAPDGGAESASPFCIKVQRALRLKGLAYEVKNVGPPDVAKLNPEAKKLPVLEVDGRRIPDSSRILRVVDELAPSPSLYPDSAADQALDHLLEDWADESLYWFGVHQRWVVDAHFSVFAAEAFGRLPPPLRWIVPPVARRNARAQVEKQGLGRQSNEAVLEQLRGHLAALDARLIGGGFLIDDAVRASDLAVFSPLRTLLSPYMPGPAELVRSYPALMAWLRRVDGVTKPDRAEAVA